MAEAPTPTARPTQSHGLKIGNITIPWWAIGVGALGVGVIGFLVYRNMQSQGPSSSTAASGSSAGTPTSPGVSSAATPTAATLVPLPYPTSSTTSGSTATQASGLGTATAIDAPGTSQIPLYSQPYNSSTKQWGPSLQIYDPTSLQITGPPITEQGNPYGGAQYPVSYLGQTYYVNASNVSASSLSNTQLAGSTS